MARPSGGRHLEIWLPLAIVLLDQASKAMVRTWLPLHESTTVIPGFMDFTHIRNTGAAFGFLDAVHFPGKTVVLSLVATGALIGIGMYSTALASHQLFARLGLALVSGGAAGNLIDRVFGGSVVDFVDVYFGSWHFWTFNVADSAITIGVIVMILDMLRPGLQAARDHAD